MWRGIAAYRGLDFLTAAQEFAHVDSVEGRFALGNAQAQNHAYEKAIKAYDEVLKAQPDNFAAKTNRAIVVAALKAREEKRRKQEDQDAAPPDEKADEMRVDPDQKGGKKIQVKPDDMTTAGAAEAWMREVQTSPADFLKLKFAIQAASRLLQTRLRQIRLLRARRDETCAHRHRPAARAVRGAAPSAPNKRCARADRATSAIDPPRVVVGQKAPLRVEVLAPNYMTSPPELPGFQVRNAVTRQLQSVNRSEERDGTSYAGVQFEYAIYPQEPGSYAVADQKVTVRYAAEPPASREAVVALPRHRLRGVHSGCGIFASPLRRRSQT